MLGYCLLFPGQGSQYVGMAKSFFTAEAAYPIKNLMLNGPIEELTLTYNAQPSILLHSVLAFRELKKQRPHINIKAAIGHSLGEYSALVCAEVMSLDDALTAVKLRGELMQKAVPVNQGAMAAILGLDADKIQDALKDHSDPQNPRYVAVANYNSPSQTVISGTKIGVENAMVKLKELGAKRCILLLVSAPFHSLLMKPAQDQLADYLANIKFSEPKFPIISTSNPQVLNDARSIKEILFHQITRPVYFTKAIEMAIELGFGQDGFLELGPGEVLGGLLKKINPSKQVKNIDSIEDIENV